PPTSPLSLHDALPISRPARAGPPHATLGPGLATQPSRSGRQLGRPARPPRLRPHWLGRQPRLDGSRDAGLLPALLELPACPRPVDRKSTRLNSSHSQI